MANPEHVTLVARGADAIREWREANSHARLNLSGTDLHAANLIRANLSGTDLHAADLSGAQLGGTSIADVDLRTVKNLKAVKHLGPSHISTDTLFKSQGDIPEEFLRGCGLGPWEVLQAKMYDPALTPHEIAELQIKIFDKRTHGPFFLGGVFISYSRADAEFVDTIYKQLTEAGANVWLDRHDVVAGDLQKQIARAIRLQDVVVLVLSKSSTKSDWVENELEMARTKEQKEKRDVLCPVALDASWEKKLANDASDRQLWRTLTKKAILDFSKWQTPDVFETEFAKLLKGLKINYEPKPKKA